MCGAPDNPNSKEPATERSVGTASALSFWTDQQANDDADAEDAWKTPEAIPDDIWTCPDTAAYNDWGAVPKEWIDRTDDKAKEHRDALDPDNTESNAFVYPKYWVPATTLDQHQSSTRIKISNCYEVLDNSPRSEQVDLVSVPPSMDYAPSQNIMFAP
jgi:hypothetical protein